MALRKGRICGIISCIIIMVVIIIIIVDSTHKSERSNDNKSDLTLTLESSTKVAPTTLSVISKMIHRDTSTGDYSSNVYSSLLHEYVEVMNAKDCYVCSYLPTSAEEGMTYHHLPLSYGITCSIAMTMIYRQRRIEYYYSNYVLTLDKVPIIRSKNKRKIADRQTTAWHFYRPLVSLDLSGAIRNHLVCEINDEEKDFLHKLEDRREKVTNKLNKGGESDLNEEDKKAKRGVNYPKLSLDKIKMGKLCFMRRKEKVPNSIFVGSSECDQIFEVLGREPATGNYPIIPGMYYICGSNAYFLLPENWVGTCYLGLVFPKIYHVHDLNQGVDHHTRSKRTVGQIVGDIFGVLIPSFGVAYNGEKIRLLATLVDRLALNSAKALKVVNTELIAIRAMVLQNRLALDMLLAKEGGVCHALKINQCCTYVPDESLEIESAVNNITNISIASGELEQTGVWNLVKKGVNSISNWFGSLPGKLLLWVLTPIIVVTILVGACLCYYKLMRKGIGQIFKSHRKKRRTSNLKDGDQIELSQLKNLNSYVNEKYQIRKNVVDKSKNEVEKLETIVEE